MFKNVVSEMGVTIQQWRCAIARPAPALRSVKVTPNHEEMLSSMRDESFKMWAFVGTIVMWLMMIQGGIKWGIRGSGILDSEGSHR